jgi:hypothetical protein
MLVETILSILTVDFKKVMHRRWGYFKTRVGFTMALSLYQSLNSVSELAPTVNISGGVHDGAVGRPPPALVLLPPP